MPKWSKLPQSNRKKEFERKSFAGKKIDHQPSRLTVLFSTCIQTIGFYYLTLPFIVICNNSSKLYYPESSREVPGFSSLLLRLVLESSTSLALAESQFMRLTKGGRKEGGSAPQYDNKVSSICFYSAVKILSFNAKAKNFQLVSELAIYSREENSERERERERERSIFEKVL